MKILLIEPPFHRFMGFYRYFFPFSLSSLAAYIKTRGYDVLVYDADHGEKPVSMTSSDLLEVFPKYLQAIQNKKHPIWNEIKNVIRDYAPDLIGITFMSTKLGAVQQITNIAKQLYPGIPVVLGGAHPSVLSHSSLEKTKADYVVIGEGEQTFCELIDVLEKGNKELSQIPGIAYRNHQKKIISTPPRPLISDIDSLPFPDRESLYKLETYRPDDLSMIMTSRGCPFNCTFCSSLWEQKVRNRSIPNIIAEIEYLINRFHTSNIYFKDDTFTVNKSRVMELCRTLMKKRIAVGWECLTRIELIDEDLTLEMRDAGMNYLKIGIETGSERILKATNKHITLEQIKKGAAILNRLNQKWSAFFMIGYPDESEEEIKMSLRLIEEIQPTYVSMSVLAPYPGCQIYYDLEKTGDISENSDWNLYDPFSLFANVNLKIPPKRFRDIVRETMRFVDEYNAGQNARKENLKKGAVLDEQDQKL